MSESTDKVSSVRQSECAGAPTLVGSDLFCAIRDSRFLIVELLRPHRVLSTCMHGGGLRGDCRYVVNHQSCEPAGDDQAMSLFRSLGIAGYHRLTCESVGLPPEATVLCGTAANMRCAAVAQRSHAELVVTAITTAGVESNATRAGDPAGWHETSTGSCRVTPLAGTIVNLVFVNQPCSAGCLVKAASMLTEAKSTVVLDLRVPSRQSSKLATGTGTDQFVVACPIGEPDGWERSYAGSHNTLGQILCEAVHQSTTEALLKQNGLMAPLRCSVFAALERHGLTKAGLEVVARRELDAIRSQFLVQNIQSLIHDPAIAASAYAIAEVLDIAANRIVTLDILGEVILNQCALLASVVALAPQRYAEYRVRLAMLSDQTAANLAAYAIVWGFGDKWTERDREAVPQSSPACVGA